MRWGLAMIAVVALSAPVRADGEKEIAAKLFKQGRDLMDAGKLDEACARFEQSLKLDPAIGTKLNLADCLEKKGKLAPAYRLFDEAAVEAAKESKEGRESFARQRADALVKKLVRIELRIAATVDGMAVMIDGETVARGAWTAPRMVAPGTIVIAVTAPGRAAFEETIDGVAGEVRIVDVPVLKKEKGGGGGGDDGDDGDDGDGGGGGTDAGAGDGTGTGAGAGPGTATGTGTGAGAGTGTGTMADARPRSKKWAWIVGGTGVAMLGTSLALGLAAKSKFDDAACGPSVGLPDGQCTEAGQDATNSARRLADIGTGFAIAGAVAVGVGVYLYFRAGKRDRVVVAPAVSDGGVGVVVTVFR